MATRFKATPMTLSAGSTGTQCREKLLIDRPLPVHIVVAASQRLARNLPSRSYGTTVRVRSLPLPPV